MSISMVDLKLQYQQLRAELEPVVLQVMAGAQYILGENVKQFEKEAADYLGCQYAVGVNSGTDALHFALRAANIQPGDEVITPSFTFFATIEAILYCGAKLVFVDIDADNFNLDLEQIEPLINQKTKAILPVDLYGQAVDMDSLTSLAKRYNLKIIEDSAQSFGASWDGKKCGSFDDLGCFSFYPTKNLSCFGDGGLVTTNSKAIYDDLLLLRNHGSYQRYHHQKHGYGSRLDEIQAAVLRVKLKYLDQFNDNRRQVAAHYDAELADCMLVPKQKPQARHIYHQYTILHPKRDDIAAALRAENIGSMIYYPIPAHRQDLFAGKYDHLPLPVTDRVSHQCLSLPIYPELQLSQIEKICDVIKRTIKKAA